MSRPAPATHPVDQPLPPELLPLVRALARMAARRQLAAAQTPEPTT
jgi:hypothetical protein